MLEIAFFDKIHEFYELHQHSNNSLSELHGKYFSLIWTDWWQNIQYIVYWLYYCASVIAKVRSRKKTGCLSAAVVNSHLVSK